MGSRYVYTPEQLLRLRESPQVERPANLPPAEEWMGVQDKHVKSGSKGEREYVERGKLPLLDQTNRRPQLDRHLSRGNTNPDDIILGPPKTSFSSATPRSSKQYTDSNAPPPLPSTDSRDRFSFRKGADQDEERIRDNRNSYNRPKRGEADQDSDGWSTVKPRKSFGAEGGERFNGRKSFGPEGAERFNGRMGGDRHREDRKFRDRDDREGREVRDRPPRTFDPDRLPRSFDSYSRDKDGEQEQDGAPRRNGMGRSRDEPSWFKDKNETPSAPAENRNDNRRSNGDRFADRTRGWREKDPEDRPVERRDDRRAEQADGRGDRRWDRDRNRDREGDRDRRPEREPEWMDEPAPKKQEKHTVEDFQKWKEEMNARNGNATAEITDQADSNVNVGQASFFDLGKPKADPTPIVPSGPDKFFAVWAKPSPASTPDSPAAVKQEAPRAATASKSSRFTSFFSPPPEEAPQGRTDPATPASVPSGEDNNTQSREKEDFARLLQKLQSQSSPFASIMQPTSQPQEARPGPPMPMQEHFQQYRSEPQEPPRSNRDSQHALQELLAGRPASVGQSPAPRPDQLLQELVNQRQNALSQTSSRSEQASNRNADFLMGLMQGARNAPEPLRPEQILMRMRPQEPQPPLQQDRLSLQQLQINEQREAEMHREQRERTTSQRQQQQQRRPELPPGFYDENLFQRGPPPQEVQQQMPRPQQPHGQPPQPTRILQRPPPPGLEQLGAPPGGFNTFGGPAPQLPPPQQQPRHIAPPPGLPGGPQRGPGGMPMSQNLQALFGPGPGPGPAGFPMGGPPPGMFPPGAGPGGPPPPGQGQGLGPGSPLDALAAGGGLGGGGGMRNLPPPPPPGIMMPPPGFMGGPPGMGGFPPGPQEMAFGAGGGPFEGRGLPPGGFRRQ